MFCNLSLEDFIKLGKREYNDRPNYYTSFKFISDITGSRETYLVEPRGNANTYILQEYVNREEDKNSYGYKVGFVNNLSIFPTQTETIKSYGYYSDQREIKNMIPVTLEEMYKTMKPLYKQCYLVNGREYEKEYSL